MIIENSLALVKPLRSIKHQTDQLFTHTGKLLDYDQCSTLLISAETNYDSQFFSASTRSARKTSNTKLGWSDFVTCSPATVTEDADYVINTSVTIF